MKDSINNIPQNQIRTIENGFAAGTPMSQILAAVPQPSVVVQPQPTNQAPKK